VSAGPREMGSESDGKFADVDEKEADFFFLKSFDFNVK